VTFGGVLKAGRQEAEAFIRVDQETPMLLQVRLRAPTSRFGKFSGDGNIRREDDQIIWDVPANGGRLNYRAILRHRRNDGGYDGLVQQDWALFRLDDLFPPAGITQADRVKSKSRLTIAAPDGWKVVTRYRRLDDRRWRVNNPARKFDRPTGWVAAGRLIIRRDNIAGTQVTVAGPVGQGVQRVSMLALLRWTLPELLPLVAEAPRRLLIVSAGDPMWRGGLSAPDSLFVNADLPLLSEDATSTLVHETVHAILPVPAAEDHDWIDEGLAEYLTLKLLERSGSISPERFVRAIERFRRRGSAANGLLTDQSAGPITSRAVVLFYDIDTELAAATGGNVGIAELAQRLAAERQRLDLARLRAIATELSGGQPLPSLAAERLDAFQRTAEL
jgi:hypothetical protein